MTWPLSGEPGRMEGESSNTLRSRFSLVAWCAFAFLWWGFAVYPEGWSGGVGMGSGPTSVAFRDVVTVVLPGFPAAKAGVRVGDTAVLRDASAGDRWHFRMHGFVNGHTYTYVMERRHAVRHVVLRAIRNPYSYDLTTWNWLLGSLGSLICAALIAWRRPQRVEARMLSLLLIAQVTADTISPTTVPTSWVTFDVIRSILSLTIHELLMVLLVFYTLLFGRPLSTLRKVLAGVALTIIGFDLLYTLAGFVGTLSGAFDLFSGPLGNEPLAFWEGLAYTVIPLLAISTAIAAARDRERSLLVWTTATIFVVYVLNTVAYVPAFIPSLDTQLFDDVLRYTGGAAALLTPFTIAYAILNRRLLDIGFVVNRGTSIALISAVAIVLFATLEWALGSFFSGLGSGAVLAINVSAAIAFGLFAPALYRWIASFVERNLFRRQYTARERIGRLAAALPFAESTAAIAETLTHGVCSSLGLPSGAVFRRERDDKIFVRDAAVGWIGGEQLEPIDAERIEMALQGTRSVLRISDQYLQGRLLPSGDRAPAVAYPLFVRQALIGFVLYSIYPGNVDLDPDERALLGEVTQQGSRGYDAVELAQRVERSYEARMEAEAESKETLRRSNAALERLNEAYFRFVPEEFLQQLGKGSIADVALGDSVLRRMTVLFSDIRGFTTLSEIMSPPGTFKFINDYLHRVGPLIREHDGFIDKYIGDAIMGLFPGKPDDALEAAVALQREIRIFNRHLSREDKPTIAAGIGIHTGELMLGTIGERGRMETTVIADAVNVASHIESVTKTFGCSILLSRETKDALAEPDRFMLRRLGSVQVKNKSEKIEVFECYAGDPSDVIEHKASTAQGFANALAAFEAGDLGAALKRFSPIAQNCAADRPAAYYLSRAREPG